MFNIEKREEGKKLELVLSGRLDTTTAPQLEEVVNKGLAGRDKLVFNLKDLEYISSAGLRALLIGQKTAQSKGGQMKLINVSESFMSVLKLSGFDSIITIE